ncbi:sporulation-induced protein [Pestalotiopsis sp. IQ-011]
MVYGSNEGFGTMPETLVENLQDAGLYFLIVSPEKRAIPAFWKTSIHEPGWKEGRDYKTIQTHIVAPQPPFIARLDDFEQERLSFASEVRDKMKRMQAIIDGLRMENKMLREELASGKDSGRTPRTSKTSKKRQSFVLPNDILPKEYDSAQVAPVVRTGATQFPAESRVTASPVRTAPGESTGFRLPVGLLANAAHPTQVQNSTKRKSLADSEASPGQSKRYKVENGRLSYHSWDDDEE